MILSDRKPRFQGHAIFNGEYLENGTIFDYSCYGMLINRKSSYVVYQMVPILVTLSDP